MNGNFRWHYVKDGEYPENTGKNREALILVKQLLPKNPYAKTDSDMYVMHGEPLDCH